MSKYTPLFTRGGQSSAGSAYPPKYMGSSVYTPSMLFWEDFHTNVMGAVSASGAVGWELTNITGTGSTARVNIGPAPTAPTSGVSALLPGAVDGNISELNIGGGHVPFYFGGAGNRCYLSVRIAMLSVNTSMMGFGLVPSGVAVGTDFITDPDTVLSATSSLVIHRHSAAYAGTTTNASVTGRMYDSPSAEQHLQIRTSPTSNVFYKYEIYWDGTSFNWAVGGVSAGALTPTGTVWNTAAGGNVRPVFQLKNSGTATPRQLYVDYLYWDATTSVVR